MGNNKEFFKNYSGPCSHWYDDAKIAIKFINFKGLDVTDINDMIIVRNIGERFIYKSENTHLHLLGYMLCKRADAFIANAIIMDKYLETKHKLDKKVAKRRG